MAKVVLAGVIREEGVAALRRRGDIEVDLLVEPTVEQLGVALRFADALLLRTIPVTEAAIAAAPRLKIVSRHGVGYDSVDVAALTARRIPLALAVTSNMVSVAEHAFFMMMELAKRGRAADAAVREHAFARRDTLGAIELAGKTLLVIGFGRIGSRIAARARAFDMRVVVSDPYVPADRIVQGGGVPVALPDGFAEADFVTLHCPLTRETRHVIGETAFELLKPSARVVNTARGGLIDEPALVRALDAGRLAGAGLDVFEVEPPRAGDPLYGRHDVLLSPHSAGVTEESKRRMAIEAAENVLAGLDGTIDPGVLANPEVLRG